MSFAAGTNPPKDADAPGGQCTITFRATQKNGFSGVTSAKECKPTVEIESGDFVTMRKLDHHGPMILMLKRMGQGLTPVRKVFFIGDATA